RKRPRSCARNWGSAMALIRVDTFRGVAPKIDPKKLPAGAAHVALNCRVDGGDLVPSNAPDYVSDYPSSLTIGTIFPYTRDPDNPATTKWLGWMKTDHQSQDAWVDVVNSPVVEDRFNRIYWSRAGTRPKFADSDGIRTVASNYMDAGTANQNLGVVPPNASLGEYPRVTAVGQDAISVGAVTLSQTTPVRVTVSPVLPVPFNDGD